MYNILYFKSAACAPCVALSPIIDELAILYTGEVEFTALDTQDEANAGLVEDAEVTVLPTLVFISDGVELRRIEGGIGSEALKTAIEEVFFSEPEPEPNPDGGGDMWPGARLFETIVWGFAIYGGVQFIKNRQQP